MNTTTINNNNSLRKITTIKPATGRRKCSYFVHGGRWTFVVGSFTLLTKVPGGRKNADKIAAILSKGVVKTDDRDLLPNGLARTNINRITKQPTLNGDFLPDYIPGSCVETKFVNHPVEIPVMVEAEIEIEQAVPVIQVGLPAEAEIEHIEGAEVESELVVTV